VLGGAAEAEVALRDGRRFDTVEILATDAANDLVLARIAVAGVSPAPLAEGVPVVGDAAFAIGSPLGMDYSLTQGIVSAVREQQGTKLLQTQTDIAPGSSGGPLLDDRGRVIGVTTATKGPGLNLAVQVEHVRALLAAPRTPRPLAPRRGGLTVAIVNVEGPPIEPVDRMRLEQAVTITGHLVDRCVKALPKGASVTLRLPAAPFGDPEVSTTLGDEAETCLRSALGGPFTAIALLQLGQLKTDAVELEVRGMAAAPELPLRVRLER
jgi:hypothetical protein